MATMNLDWHQSGLKREHTCIIINKQRLTSHTRTHTEHDNLRFKRLFSLLRSTLLCQINSWSGMLSLCLREANFKFTTVNHWRVHRSDVFRFEDCDCLYFLEKLRKVDGASPLNSAIHSGCFFQVMANRFQNMFGYLFCFWMSIDSGFFYAMHSLPL